MAMEEVLDSVRRIVSKWVNTTSRVQSNITTGDTTICVKNSSRFSYGDAVMLKNNSVYETGLVVDSVDNQAGVVTLTTPVLNDWAISADTVLIKTIYEQFVQGIYIGGPDVISHFPAVTVNGISRSSEWLTLESSKERYEIEIGVYVKASTHEDGYRFLLNIADEIQQGLKRNIVPLVHDYDIISLTQDIVADDTVIYVNNRDVLINNQRMIIEDEYESQEHWATHLFTEEEDPTGTAVQLQQGVCWAFDADNTSIVVPKRFIYNSWPGDIQYGTIHSGELLKAATIKWFAEEEETQWHRRSEMRLR
jgi:hypothetical protein